MNKLAILGSGPATRETAPFDDKSYDIWIFNEAATSPWCKRWDACFQMHKPEIYTGHNTKDPKHWQWLQQAHGKPIYMQTADPRVPDAIEFPLVEAKALAGVQMFPTTFAYMAALAVLKGYKEISFYGVELSASEYQYQANGYLFWFGFLRGRLGAENVDSAVLYLSENIFEVPLYGYEGNFAFGADHFQARALALDAEWQAAEKNLQGSLKAVNRAVEKTDFDKVPDLIKAYQGAAILCGEKAGALAEAERYAAFGERFADRGGFEFAGATAQRDGEEKRVLSYMLMGKVEYVWNLWMQTKSRQAAEQFEALTKQAGQLAYDTGAHLGMYKENVDYIVKYDAMVQANGGLK